MRQREIDRCNDNRSTSTEVNPIDSIRKLRHASKQVPVQITGLANVLDAVDRTNRRKALDEAKRVFAERTARQLQQSLRPVSAILDPVAPRSGCIAWHDFRPGTLLSIIADDLDQLSAHHAGLTAITRVGAFVRHGHFRANQVEKGNGNLDPFSWPILCELLAGNDGQFYHTLVSRIRGEYRAAERHAFAAFHAAAVAEWRQKSDAEASGQRIDWLNACKSVTSSREIAMSDHTDPFGEGLADDAEGESLDDLRRQVSAMRSELDEIRATLDSFIARETLREQMKLVEAEKERRRSDREASAG